MREKHAVVADNVFDGDRSHPHTAVVFEGPTIVGLIPRLEVSAEFSTQVLPDGVWLAPGFIDIQVNGGGDVLFNDSPTTGGIFSIAQAHRQFGTTSFLPTLITDVPERTTAALEAVKRAIAIEPGILGLHLEGPFLSPDKPGVHKRSLIRIPTPQDLAILIAPRSGILLVTLAPEQVPSGFIAALTAAGVRVALGHSMASYEQTQAAMAEGLTGFTHLFNAMRPLGGRDPGPVAVALTEPKSFFGLIADGVHVHPTVLRIALGGKGTPMLVTDAMPPVGGQCSTFLLYGEPIEVRDGRCIGKDGTLAGAFLDMASAVRNCVRLLGITLEQSLRLASTNPAQFLGLDHVLGKLAPGHRTDMMAFEPQTVTILETWVAGRRSSDNNQYGT
jgi:N-acetylglucosamine-6-phosphate deacetylase